ncbi:galactosylceramidase [Thermodesulfobacteriota bacterium]
MALMHKRAAAHQGMGTYFVLSLIAAALTLTSCDSDGSGSDVEALPACEEPAEVDLTITLSPAEPGRVFDGIGAVSSAGNTRYLLDYPEPQRSEILDYLFKPGYGASLHILKVEIAGDGNSTDGAEASHMHTRDIVDCDASYQFWLMKEAKARNPQILLAGLAWSAPRWLGDGNFWSQDSIDYLMAWLDCAEAQGLTIDYIGGRNEMGFDRDWFIALRAAVDEHHRSTKIIGADTIRPYLWIFVDAMECDPELVASVDKVGVHYPCSDTHCCSPANAQAIGRPLWNSEGSSPEGGGMARILNRQYIDGRYTAFISWPLISACSDQTAYGGGQGLVEAREPWSGSWRVRPKLWTLAHTTRFTQPGWQYLDSASGYLADEPAPGSYVTLLSPEGSDFTIVVETSTAEAALDVALVLEEGLPEKALQVCVSDLLSADESDHFVALCTAEPTDRMVKLTLEPHSLYTLTTITNEAKGETTIPEQAPFPLPYDNDFEADEPGREARYLANQNGVFVVAPCTGGRSGDCLEQVVPAIPNPWLTRIAPPFALIGDANLDDYTISADFLVDGEGGVTLYGRYTEQSYTFLTIHKGYRLQINSAGTWSIRRSDGLFGPMLASGTCAAIESGTWHTLVFTLEGSELGAALDGEILGSATDGTYRNGLAGLGCGDGSINSGWANNQFDNLAIGKE